MSTTLQANFPWLLEASRNHIDRATSPLLSIVVPLFHEEANVAPLCHRLDSVLKVMDIEFEVILVDDGSSDATWEEIENATSLYNRVVGLRLSRNFGHQHALFAGLVQARGNAIVTMDGDLQHPPEKIPELFRLWASGVKIVGTNRLDVKVASRFKRWSSRTFYRVFSSLSGVAMPPGSSDFRLIDHRVRDELVNLGGADPFIRGSLQWLGYETAIVDFTADKRNAGTTKYSLKRMVGFALGAIISFSTKPLWAGIWLGVLTSVLAFLELIYILVQYLAGVTVPGWASTLGITSFLFGILFIILGIIGIYLSRIHVTLQNRPAFIVSEVSISKKSNTPHE